MKNKSILSKCKKANLEIKKEKTNKYINYTAKSEMGYYLIEWDINIESDEKNADVHTLRLRRFNDHTDTMTDYFAGSYYESIQPCIDSLLRLESDKKETLKKQEAEGLKEIIFHQLEGKETQCKPVTLKTIKGFKKEIESRLMTFSDMGYDKANVKIRFNNGDEYEFRMDCKHPLNEYYRPSDYDLISHIRETSEYYKKQINGEEKNYTGITQKELFFIYSVINRLQIQTQKEAA